MKIIPKEKRLITYSVYNGEIINADQKNLLKNDFISDINKINEARANCLAAMNNTNNLFGFVYVHSNGKIEKEENEKRPKYAFHINYNDDLFKN